MPTGSGGGIASVSTNATLSGSGTAASPLGVAGLPLTLFMYGLAQDGAHTATANKINYTGFTLTAAVTFSHITVIIAAADGVNNNDIGIYNAAGSTLIADIGAQHLASTGTQTIAIAQAAQTITPANYIIAYTSVGSTLSLAVDNHWPAWESNFSGTGTTSGGALPASFTPGAVTPLAGSSLVFALS